MEFPINLFRFKWRENRYKDSMFLFIISVQIKNLLFLSFFFPLFVFFLFAFSFSK